MNGRAAPRSQFLTLYDLVAGVRLDDTPAAPTALAMTALVLQRIPA